MRFTAVGGPPGARSSDQEEHSSGRNPASELVRETNRSSQRIGIRGWGCGGGYPRHHGGALIRALGTFGEDPREVRFFDLLARIVGLDVSMAAKSQNEPHDENG